MAQGKLDQTVKVYSKDEIGQLSESFNYMAMELSRTLGEMSKEKNKLEIILHNMTDGVLSFDKSGQIVHCNSAVLELLGIDEFKDDFNGFINRYGINKRCLYRHDEHRLYKKINFWAGKKYINAVSRRI